MNKLLSFTGGLPNFSIDEVLFNDDAIRSALQEIFRAFGDNYIIQGVTGTTSITAGYIMLDGELLQVDAHTKTNTHFAKVTTYDPLGDITFNDGVARQTWQKNRATISASSGSLAYATAKRLSTMIDYNKGYNTKIIEIGDWDMDATASVTVAHGLTYANIIDVTATIRADSPGIDYKGSIVHIDNSTGLGSGFVSAGTTLVTLTRVTGGFFDSTNFNQTSFNRGWIFIKYIP